MADLIAPGELPVAATSTEEKPQVAVEEKKQEATEETTQEEDKPSIRQDNEAEDSDAPSSPESGETSSPSPDNNRDDAPPLPNEAPPLPAGPPPAEDDGWDFHWDATNQAYFFHNRNTGATTWENPRTTAPVAAASASAPGAPGAPGTSASSSLDVLSAPPPLPSSRPAAGGYNPAIHGDYDPNAWYAQTAETEETSEGQALSNPEFDGQVAASFNRFTGQFQRADEGPDRHTDEAKSRRQMNAFFDVDAAANAHDGRSLKAERSGKKISKSELKHFKEKRKARKEEKRRAWLRD